MIGLALALAFTATPPSSERVKLPPPPCPSPPPMLIAHTGKAGFKRLGDLPDANLEIAVSRVQGGCVRPLIIAYRVSR